MLDGPSREPESSEMFFGASKRARGRGEVPAG
jgi:hypothetical protein